MSITINPGAGPIEGTTEENARTNMDAFVADLVPVGITTTAITRNPGADADGRYGYQLGFDDGRVLDVMMPGLPLDQVRYMDEPGQDIWDFPRLYVDGNSWIWLFALRQCEPDEGSAASADEAPQTSAADQILAATEPVVMAQYEQLGDDPARECTNPECACIE